MPPLRTSRIFCSIIGHANNIYHVVSRRLLAKGCHSTERNRTVEFILMNSLLGAVTLATMVIRLVYRRFYSAGRKLMFDDWLIVSIFILGAPSIAINVFGLAFHGLGQDVWGISLSELETFHNYFFAMELLYLILLTLIKLTLSLFYLNIFLGCLVRRILWGTVVFQILFGVSFVVKCIFQCSPTQYYWAKFSDEITVGHCINVNASGWANAGISIAVDLWLIGIPLTQIGKLRLHWKKKAAASVMFLIGTV